MFTLGCCSQIYTSQSWTSAGNLTPSFVLAQYRCLGFLGISWWKMGEQYSRTGPTTVRSKLTMLQGFTPALLRSTKKCNLLLTLLIASELKTESSFPLMMTGSNACLFFLKSVTLIGIQGHLVVAWTVLDSVTALWMLLSFPRGTTSVTVVSSMYFQVWKPETLRSFIININNQGSSLAPWGTSAGTGPHSEKQLADSLTRCCRSIRKSATRWATLLVIDKLETLCANKVLKVIKSKAFP